MGPKLRAAIAVLAVAEGLAAYATLVPEQGMGAVLGALGVWAFVAAGLVAMQLRPENRTGILLVVVGLLIPVGELARITEPVPWTMGKLLSPYWIGACVYLLLCFPYGHLKSRFDRLLMAAVGVQVALWNPVIFLFWDSSEPTKWPGTPSGLNLLFLRDAPSVGTAINQFSSSVDLLVLVCLIVTLVLRWRRASVPARRVLNPVLLTGALAILYALVAIESGNFVPNATFVGPLRTLIPVATATVPFGFLVGLLRARARRGRVAELVLELADLPTAERLRPALVKALGDPSLDVGVWDPDSARHVTDTGAELALPRPEDGRVATTLSRHGEPLAVIVHDPVLLDEPDLVASVTAATRLAVENEKLQAEVLRQLAEVHSSRARIVESTDEERRRIERNIHDGAQQRLVSLSLALQIVQGQLAPDSVQARTSLEEARRELETALTELRELARGTYPALLTDEGLAAALESLADRAGVAVELDVSGLRDARLPEKVEATAYFVAAEALTNVTRYSGAKNAAITATLVDDTLQLEIGDCGVGGADATRGTGLAGLRDRVEALDGELTIESPIGAGTRVLVRIPCA
ncbi:MAG: sensor histidine kinase [Actinomycetota bacterium]|nr:sensor histidine kinase [Actinomycetota bacterium]